MVDKKTSAKQGNEAPEPTPLPDPASGNTAPHPPTAAVMPKVGEQWMVKHPSVDGQWQICAIIQHPVNEGAILVVFPDGTRYEPQGLELGGKVATEPPAPAAADIQDARVSPLSPEYAAFHKVLVELNAQSKRMFQLPIGVLITMVSRLATEHEIPGTGHMAIHGGLTTFVADQPTFALWVEDYLLEVQNRESRATPE